MMRHPRFCVFGFTVTLTFVICLLATAFPVGSYAEATLLLPGQVFIAQASSNDGDDPDGAEDLPPGPLAYEKTGSQAVIQLYAGFNYRTDELNWNIAGQPNGTSPNILSELTWEDLGIYEVSLGFSSFVKKRVYFRGYMNYGRIMSGENQDSDYYADDRQDEFSRSNNSADDGNTIDVSLGAGLMLPIIKDVITVMPLVGLSYHGQNLTITDGFQTIPATGAFPDLDSTYEAQWMGPWIGLEMQMDMVTGWRVVPRIVPFVGVEYHWAVYNAEADWNLREDFDHPKSFEHEAEANGIRFMVGLSTFLTEKWSLGIEYTQQQWSVEDGTDRVFFSDGTYAETRLNEVNWNSQAMGLAISYQF